MPNVIGTITVAAGEATKSFETAAWSETIEYPAQTVDVILSDDEQAVVYAMHGRIVHENFPSLFGGVPTGGGNVGPCDREGAYTVQLYPYQAAAMALAGTIELAEGWEVRSRQHRHPVSCRGYRYVEGGNLEIEHCDHEEHVDYLGAPVERTGRGHLAWGYVPGEGELKVHHRLARVGSPVG